MSTTGLTAQAQGAKDLAESRAVLARSGLIGLVLGLSLLILFPVIRQIALGAFGAVAVVKVHAGGPVGTRRTTPNIVMNSTAPKPSRPRVKFPVATAAAAIPKPRTLPSTENSPTSEEAIPVCSSGMRSGM